MEGKEREGKLEQVCRWAKDGPECSKCSPALCTLLLKVLNITCHWLLKKVIPGLLQCSLMVPDIIPFKWS